MQQTSCLTPVIFLRQKNDEVILSEIFSAVDEIKQEADKLHLLSTASQNSLLLSHLLEQTILKEIFSGEHMDKSNSPCRLHGPNSRWICSVLST